MIDKPLPPAVFGEEPKYVAIRKDVADIRSPMSSTGLAQIHQNFPGDWTYLTIAEVIECINAKQEEPSPVQPSPSDSELADKLRRLQLAVTSYANMAELFTKELRKAIGEVTP